MKWLAELPTTNVRIAVTLVLNVVVVLAWLVGCLFMQRPEPGGLDPILLFLAALSGVDALSYFGKRVTYKAGPPAQPDVEDAKAGATIDPPPGAVTYDALAAGLDARHAAPLGLARRGPGPGAVAKVTETQRIAIQAPAGDPGQGPLVADG